MLQSASSDLQILGKKLVDESASCGWDPRALFAEMQATERQHGEQAFFF